MTFKVKRGQPYFKRLVSVLPQYALNFASRHHVNLCLTSGYKFSMPGLLKALPSCFNLLLSKQNKIIIIEKFKLRPTGDSIRSDSSLFDHRQQGQERGGPEAGIEKTPKGRNPEVCLEQRLGKANTYVRNSFESCLDSFT